MTLDEVKNKSDKYDEKISTSKGDLSDRFKSLVKQHGVSYVSAATGLAESSVSQYNRCKVVPVSEYNVIKAETILNQ